MKIYKIRSSYAAIIVAKGIEELISKYEEVCEIDDLDAFKSSIYTLDREVCVEEVAEAFDETNGTVIGIKKAKQIVNDALYSDQSTLLVIDTDLI